MRSQTLPVAIAASLLIVLTQFQNCASVSSPMQTEMKIPGTFAFSHSHIEVYDEAGSVQMSGTCDPRSEGSNLQWNLLNNKNSLDPIVTGEATCLNGMFQFSLIMKEDMVCGLDHVLRMQSATGMHVEAEISKRCQPLASAKLPGHCELEFNLKNDESGGRVCEKVCYSSNRLVSSELRLESDCATLASTLAGQ